jgi:hypothetical protein
MLRVIYMSENRPPKRSKADDDRNLVVVDEDFANADAEDRLWLFWERNKTVIVRSITSVVCGVLAFLAFYFWRESQREALGESYVACQNETQRRAFANAYPKEPLAAIALIEVADELRRKNKLDEAVKTYDEAAKIAASVGETEAVKAIAVRAKLFSGLCRQELGQANAESVISSVAEDNTAPETLRGYAMYVLANLALTRGDTASAAKWINLMDKRLQATQVWAQDKNWLVRSEPSLLTPLNPDPVPAKGK